ncbi:MAG: hypothetical protein ACJASQ_001254 [Crocinitomicaceae bacterium]|jgi:hypothetical protein
MTSILVYTGVIRIQQSILVLETSTIMNLVALTEEQFKMINEKLDFLINKEADTSTESKLWLSSSETMKILGVGQTTLWSYRKQGKIKSRKINRKLYFSAQEVNQLIENS